MTDKAGYVALGDAEDPLVLAMDVGSTATRGGVYDATGQPIKELRHKVPHAFTSGADGTSEIDPDQVTAEVEQILDALTDEQSVGDRITGVAMDTFAASLVAVDGDARPLTACLTYADSRCASQVTALRDELDEHAVQQRTGTRIHTSYHAPRFRWLAETAPDTFAAAAGWWSLGEYVFSRLRGDTAAGTSTAAWTGLLDRRTGQLDDELLAASGARRDQFSPIHAVPDPLPPKPTRWPALQQASWFPVITDGFASNYGAGATDPSRMAAATATSGALRVLLDQPADPLPFGLWNYRVDGSRTLLGGALNDVGRAVSWARATLNLDDDLAPVLTADPSAGTPLVLPYLTGERAPGWMASARAMLSGVTAANTPEDVFRGIIEGVAITYARVAADLSPAAPDALQIMAAGSVSKDLPDWLQILADVLGRPVTHVTTKRATLRGMALVALDVLAPEVSRAPMATGRTYEPEQTRADYYAQRQERFAQLYETLVGH